MKLSEAAARVITIATAIRDYWNTELPKRHPHYPVIGAGEDSGPPPREEAELNSFFSSLPEDDIYKLILLMYLGRGDFGTHDLAMHFRTVKDRFRKREWAISQMKGKAPLADYLADGIEELRKSGIDMDQLFAPVKSGS